MRRRYNLAHLILAGVVALGLTPLMACVDAQAQIAFSSNREGNSEIYVMDADGGNLQTLTNNPGIDGYPAWSLDGEHIAFASGRDGNREIYVMDADGSNQQNLTNSLHLDWDPSWSPDSKRIAFVSNKKGGLEIKDGNLEIYLMDANGNNQRNLTNNRHNDWYPSWSPDGKRIAYASFRNGNREIYVMDTDGGNRRNLTNNPFKDWAPSWSPNGKRIAFVSNRDGNDEIYAMDADGGNQQNLTNNPHNDTDPAWFAPAFSVASAGKKSTIRGWLKQINR